MNFGFSGELIFLALLGLILFGPRKLPEIARKAGRLVDDLKRAGSEFQVKLNREVESLGSAGDSAKDDPTKNLLTSLLDDLRELRSESQTMKAIMPVSEPVQPAAGSGEASLIDSVAGIKDLLANDSPSIPAGDLGHDAPASTGTITQEQSIHPAECAPPSLPPGTAL